jgi:hypothetical protein
VNAFLGGILFGALFAGAVAVIFVTRVRRPQPEPVDWTEQAYQAPVVTTRIVNRHRTIDI